MNLSKKAFTQDLEAAAALRSLGQTLVDFPLLDDKELQEDMLATGERLIQESFLMEEEALKRNLQDDEGTPMSAEDFDTFVENIYE